MKYIWELVRITIGCAIQAAALNLLIIPAHLMSGGLTGLCILLMHFTGISVSLSYAALNIPLLLIGYRHLGRRFMYYTIYAIAVFTGMLSVIHINHTLTSDPWLGVLFGGVLISFGGAMVLRAGGSSGGLDIPARLVAKRTNMTMGRFNMIVNGIIIAASAYIFQVQMAMYTMVFIFVSGFAYDRWFLNQSDRLSVRIVSEKGAEIAERIQASLVRGVTKIEGEGGYSGNEKQVLICVIVREELYDLIQLLKEVDPNVFADVTESVTVIGRFRKDKNRGESGVGGA